MTYLVLIPDGKPIRETINPSPGPGWRELGYLSEETP